MTEKQSIHCSECGLLIIDSATDPCPRCGSLDRTVSVHFAEELEVVGTVTVTADDQLVRGRGTVVNPATLTVKASFPQGQIIVVDPRPVLPLGDLSIRMATIDQPTYQAMIGSEALEPSSSLRMPFWTSSSSFTIGTTEPSRAVTPWIR